MSQTRRPPAGQGQEWCTPSPPPGAPPPANPRKDPLLVCTSWTVSGRQPSLPRETRLETRFLPHGPRSACLGTGLTEGPAPTQGPRAAPGPALASVCTLHASVCTLHACDPSSQHTLGSVFLFSYFLFLLKQTNRKLCASLPCEFPCPWAWGRAPKDSLQLRPQGPQVTENECQLPPSHWCADRAQAPRERGELAGVG